MIFETVVIIERHERNVFKTASNWMTDDDRQPGEDGLVTHLLTRGGTFTKPRIETALAELGCCRRRLQGSSVVGAPAGLVAPGFNAAEFDADRWELASRELEPAIRLLAQAFAGLER